MFLSSEKIIEALTIVENIQKQLTIPSGSEQGWFISVEQVKQVAAAKCGLPITTDEVAFEAVHIRGRFHRWKDRIEIHIRQAQTVDWKRMVVTKELMHLFVDKDCDLIPYADQVLEQLVEEGHFGWLNSMNGDGTANFVQSEVIAEIAALELLFPLDERLSALQELSENNTTKAQLARKYGIPELYIGNSLNLKYMKLLKNAFEDIESRSKAAE